MKETGLFIAIASILGAVIFVAWRMWRHLRIPIDTSELDLAFTTASPHTLDSEIFLGKHSPQFIRDGVGPLFHRRYYVDLKGVDYTKQSLMSEIITNLNTFTANDMAIFEKLDDDEMSQMKAGDDYFIHIAGPWNGPVRVIEVTPISFSFITLDDHLEAGEIQFRLIDHPDDESLTRFEIRSWSRSKDRFVDFLYNYLPIVKLFQTRMWVYFCQRVVEVSEGEAVDEVHVVTHRVPWQHYQRNSSDNTDRWQQYRPDLERLRQADLNFDLDKREEFVEANGWNLDTYQIDLPDESPGMPEANGSWQTAKQVLLNYEFPDPKLITGIFVPDDPLEERVMVLQARFLIFKFEFGVRINRVVDEKRQDDEKGEAHVWGYSYQTLEGHFEMGEITFEIWKFLESGKIEFRIHSYSKTGHISNPFYRMGFAIFGRRLQKRFAHTALERTQKLVIHRLGDVRDDLDRPEIEPLAKTPSPG